MSDSPTRHPCVFCEHEAADADHYNREHPLPESLSGRGTYRIGWDGRPYVTYVPGHQPQKENNP